MKRHQNDGVSKRCQCPRREWSRCVHPWHLAFKRGGNRYRFSLSRMARTLGEPIPASKTEAKALADRLRGEIRAGRTPVARPVPTPDVSGLTFGDVCNRYSSSMSGKSIRQTVHAGRDIIYDHARRSRLSTTSAPFDGFLFLPHTVQPSH